MWIRCLPKRWWWTGPRNTGSRRRNIGRATSARGPSAMLLLTTRRLAFWMASGASARPGYFRGSGRALGETRVRRLCGGGGDAGGGLQLGGGSVSENVSWSTCSSSVATERRSGGWPTGRQVSVVLNRTRRPAGMVRVTIHVVGEHCVWPRCRVPVLGGDVGGELGREVEPVDIRQVSPRWTCSIKSSSAVISENPRAVSTGCGLVSARVARSASCCRTRHRSNADPPADRCAGPCGCGR